VLKQVLVFGEKRFIHIPIVKQCHVKSANLDFHKGNENDNPKIKVSNDFGYRNSTRFQTRGSKVQTVICKSRVFHLVMMGIVLMNSLEISIFAASLLRIFLWSYKNCKQFRLEIKTRSSPSYSCTFVLKQVLVFGEKRFIHIPIVKQSTEQFFLKTVNLI
jgi:hypothetical protein